MPGLQPRHNKCSEFCYLHNLSCRGLWAKIGKVLKLRLLCSVQVGHPQGLALMPLTEQIEFSSWSWSCEKLMIEYWQKVLCWLWGHRCVHLRMKKQISWSTALPQISPQETLTFKGDPNSGRFRHVFEVRNLGGQSKSDVALVLLWQMSLYYTDSALVHFPRTDTITVSTRCLQRDTKSSENSFGFFCVCQKTLLAFRWLVLHVCTALSRQKLCRFAACLGGSSWSCWYFVAKGCVQWASKLRVSNALGTLHALDWKEGLDIDTTYSTCVPLLNTFSR